MAIPFTPLYFSDARGGATSRATRTLVAIPRWGKPFGVTTEHR
jgi:hypothetical protein